MHLLAALFCAFGIGTASAAEDESTIDFDMEGYYRTRGYVFKELFAAPIAEEDALRVPSRK